MALQTPAQKYDHFRQHLKGINTGFRKRTSSLRGLCNELERQVTLNKRQGKTPTPFTDVQHARSFCKNPADPRINKYDYHLRRLVESWGRAHDYKVQTNVQRLIQSVRQELDACSGFTCNDAVTFSGDVNPAIGKKKKDEILAKAKLARGALPPIIPKAADAPLGINDTRWNADVLRASKNRVFRNGAAECTNFGYSAAHILSTQPFSGTRPRIEVVSFDSAGIPGFKPKKGIWPTHVFCVVGRTGGTTLEKVSRRQGLQHRLPAYDTWGDDVWIVDTWLASLGWNSCYKLKEYPKKSYLSPCFQVFDSFNTQRVRGLNRGLPDWAIEQANT